MGGLAPGGVNPKGLARVYLSVLLHPFVGLGLTQTNGLTRGVRLGVWGVVLVVCVCVSVSGVLFSLMCVCVTCRYFYRREGAHVPVAGARRGGWKAKRNDTRVR